MNNKSTESINLTSLKYDALKDFIIKYNLSNNYSIIGIYDQTITNKIDTLNYDFLINLSKDVCSKSIVQTATLFRNSDSLIEYSKNTLKLLFEEFDKGKFFKSVDIGGKQVALFIKEIDRIDLNKNNYKSSIDDIYSGSKLQNDFNIEFKDLSLRYFYRSSVAQHNPIVTQSIKQIQNNQCDNALNILRSSQFDSVLFSKELLEVEALRKLKKNVEADSVIDKITSSLPYNHFAHNLLIKDLTDRVNEFYNYPKKLDLLIYDRIFPSPNCSFAICEFNSYLDSFDSSRVFTSGIDFPKDKSFTDLLNDYEKLYPKFVNRIEKINAKSKVFAKVYYTLFLGNAYLLLPLVEANKGSLIFTLYSGGEFCLNDYRSDQMLKEIFASPAFTKVIVVQKTIYDYLLENDMVSSDKIEFIYGPICNTEYLINNKYKKIKYPDAKSTFDIAFVANKNMSKGEDKGYDTFINTAILLLKTSDKFKFHVVGGFNEKDIPLGTHRNHFTFYGHQPMQFFSAFYASVDLIMSPCRPNVLAKGAIDGAPNVSAIEAGLSGTAVFITDQLGQNLKYEWDKEIVNLSDNPEDNSGKILNFFKNPEKLYKLAENGAYKFAKVSSFESQLQPRIKLIKEAIEKHS